MALPSFSTFFGIIIEHEGIGAGMLADGYQVLAVVVIVLFRLLSPLHQIRHLYLMALEVVGADVIGGVGGCWGAGRGRTRGGRLSLNLVGCLLISSRYLVTLFPNLWILSDLVLNIELL